MSKAIYIIMLLVTFSTAAQATEFKVTNAKISKIGNGYILDAAIKYPLTPRVEEAIANGVPITFIQDLEIIRDPALPSSDWLGVNWFNDYLEKTLWTSQLHYELRYHALTQQFILHSIDTKQQRNFPSLFSALTALGKINKLSLPPEHMTDTSTLLLRIRSGLDLYALPTPMRPGALISSKWDLTSQWKTVRWP